MAGVTTYMGVSSGAMARSLPKTPLQQLDAAPTPMRDPPTVVDAPKSLDGLDRYAWRLMGLGAAAVVELEQRLAAGVINTAELVSLLRTATDHGTRLLRAIRDADSSPLDGAPTEALREVVASAQRELERRRKGEA